MTSLVCNGNGLLLFRMPHLQDITVQALTKNLTRRKLIQYCLILGIPFDSIVKG